MWDSLAILFSAVALGTPQAGAATNWQPTWSPEGKWIAYASDREGSIDIWKTDGVHVRRVVPGGVDPAWSPDGKQIAFVPVNSSGTTGIALVGSTGKLVRQLAPAPAGGPSWSPDARKIAFYGDGGEGCCGFSLFVVGRDGSERHKLVESADETTDYLDPAWSPDGKKVAYTSPGGGAIGIAYTVGGGYSLLPVQALTAMHPSWSPDGRRIVFVALSKDTGQPGADFGPMFIVDLRTERVRRLTRMLGNGPAWSPGGKRIAFAARAVDGRRLVLERADRPLRASEIHVAASTLLGRPLRWSSVKGILSAYTLGGDRRFSRVRRGVYEMRR